MVQSQVTQPRKGPQPRTYAPLSREVASTRPIVSQKYAPEPDGFLMTARAPKQVLSNPWGTISVGGSILKEGSGGDCFTVTEQQDKNPRQGNIPKELLK